VIFTNFECVVTVFSHNAAGFDFFKKIILSLQVQNGWNYQNNKIRGLSKQIWKLFSLYYLEVTREASYKLTKPLLYFPFTISLEQNKKLRVLLESSLTLLYSKRDMNEEN